MDTVRSFKTLAKQRLKEQRAQGDGSLSLQQTQHRVAQDAGFANRSALLASDDFDRRFALLMQELPQLTAVGMDGDKGTALGLREWLALSPAERESKYAELRLELRQEIDAVRWVHDWLLAKVSPIKSPNRSRSSYGLKHLAEGLRGAYLTNGAFIAGALIAGFSCDVKTPGMLARNVIFNMSERDLKSEDRRRDALRHRPHAARESEPLPVDGAAPFHGWLLQQIDRDDPVGDLASDYAEEVRNGRRAALRSATEAVEYFGAMMGEPWVYDAALEAVHDWLEAEPDADPVRTARVDSSSDSHDGWGAGAGTTERHTFHCPCGGGRIVEEHENTPGFREHDVWIECDRCRDEWQFVPRRTARDWALRPTVAVGV